MEIYLSDINPTFKDMFRSEFITSLDQLLRLIILSESDKRRNQQLDEAECIGKSVCTDDYPKSILKKLEKTIGPIRLLVVSENSGKVIISHRIQKAEIEMVRETSANKQQMIIDIFDKPRKYLVIVDCRDDSFANKSEKVRMKNILNPIIETIIKSSEKTFFTSNALFLESLETIETTNMSAEGLGNDYRAFVTNIIQESIDPLEFHQAREDKEYIDNFLKALDICRELPLKCGEDEKDHLEYLQQKIDIIL